MLDLSSLKQEGALPLRREDLERQGHLQGTQETPRAFALPSVRRCCRNETGRIPCACAAGLRPKPQQEEGLSRPRHDRPLAFRRRGYPALRETLGHRGVLQGVQVLPATRQRLPFRLLRCDDGACCRRLHTIYAPGCRGT